MQISYVILHYLDINSTENLVEIILQMQKNSQRTMSYKIIIVDNNSNNGTGKALFDKYETEKDIVILIQKDNLGFAKGNNVGFVYAKQNYNPNFILLVNNDIIFKNDTFVDQMIIEYEEKQFDVAGPKIWSLSAKKDQNPVPARMQTISSLHKRIAYLTVRIVCSYIPFLNTYLVNTKDKHDLYIPLKESEDYMLYGALLIFSKSYIQKFNGIYSKTFMFAEEDILKWRVTENHLKMLFLPTLSVLHTDHVATNRSIVKAQKIKRFFFIQSLKSTLTFLRVMKYGE